MANHSTNSLCEPSPETSRLLWGGGVAAWGNLSKSLTAEEMQSGLKPYERHHPHKVDDSLKEEEEASSGRPGSLTLVGIQAEERVLAAEADAEGPASRGGALGVGDLHEVDVAVGGDKVQAAQRVEAAAGLPERRPHLVPQLLGKLDGTKRWKKTWCDVLREPARVRCCKTQAA